MRPRVLDCVVGALIVCHHARSGFALSTARWFHRAGGTPHTQYLFLAHHKAGTELNLHIANDMSEELSIPFEHVLWAAVSDASRALLGTPVALKQSEKEFTQGQHVLDTVTSTGCSGNITFYEDIRAPLLDQILKTCPGTRAVHLVRRPSQVMVSNYAYTRDLQPGEDRGSDVKRGEVLRAHSLEWGVSEECERYFKTYHGQMLAVHQMIQDNKLDNVLEVRFEDFGTRYDSTTRSIFEHFLGSDHPSIDNLVKQASQHDINRMDPGVVANNSHISGRTEKKEVEKEMTMQRENGNECFKKLEEADRLMGYTEL